ncbi:type II secretion system protein [Halobacteriales archaeon QS_1_68_17]|nr:MAG: type II secretion system protein [Halobacteriales archaeon QS_1_68_17]
MASLAELAPLAVAAAILALVALGRVDDRVDDRLGSVASAVFGPLVGDSPSRTRLLRAAYVAETYRSYAAKTYLYAALFAVAGGIGGIYLPGALLAALPAIGEALTRLPLTIQAALGYPDLDVQLPPRQLLLVVGAGGVLGGLSAGVATYLLRWKVLESRAEARRRGINEGMPRTVAFLYALARGGLAVPDIMRTLSRNRSVYGDAADELSIAAREMDLFGTDVITALERVTERTPSDEFRTFGENLGSVLGSGQTLSGFLKQQYDRYQAEAEDRQAEVLELLATLAEAYVTVLVAGTLFLMTILLVFGLTTADTFGLLQLLAYVAIPLANVGFVFYLDQQLSLLGIDRSSGQRLPERVRDRTTEAASIVPGGTGSGGSSAVTDGGAVHDREWNMAQLRLYDQFERAAAALGQPLAVVLREPTKILYVTVPAALVWIGPRAPAAFRDGFSVRLLDDVLVQAALFVLGTFAVVRYLHRRRIDRIEAATPELLDRLASLNEAGMTLVKSLDRVRGGDLGALSHEVDLVWADVELGANVDEALVRFASRIETSTITRSTTLLVNAMRASGNLAPVLRIASQQARNELRLRRQRRQQMLTYLVVIYVAFVVFLLIIVAVNEVLVPSLPSSVPSPPSDNRLGIDPSQFTRFGRIDKAAYTLVFFHTALIQAVLSGFVAGQLGEGTLKDGAKHATILLGAAYVGFLLLTSPTASMVVADQTATDAVRIERVSLSDGGYVVLRANGPEGQVIGRSEYLPPGATADFEIELDDPPDSEVTVVAVPHRDSDGDRQFEYAGGPVDPPYPGDVGETGVEFVLRPG